jgi:hypothetical protein
MIVGSVADVSEVHAATLKMEVACTSEMSATSPTTTRFDKLTSTLITVYSVSQCFIQKTTVKVSCLKIIQCLDFVHRLVF